MDIMNESELESESSLSEEVDGCLLLPSRLAL